MVVVAVFLSCDHTVAAEDAGKDKTSYIKVSSSLRKQTDYMNYTMKTRHPKEILPGLRSAQPTKNWLRKFLLMSHKHEAKKSHFKMRRDRERHKSKFLLLLIYFLEMYI